VVAGRLPTELNLSGVGQFNVESARRVRRLAVVVRPAVHDEVVNGDAVVAAAQPDPADQRGGVQLGAAEQFSIHLGGGNAVDDGELDVVLDTAGHSAREIGQLGRLTTGDPEQPVRGIVVALVERRHVVVVL